jgi:quercetin dioxygenase-like cupin family protein
VQGSRLRGAICLGAVSFREPFEGQKYFFGFVEQGVIGVKNNWENIKSLVSYSHGGVLSKGILANGALNISLFCLAAGTEISEHASTKEGFVFVLEGKGVFWLKGKPIKMLPGVLIHLKKNARHSLKAQKNTAFLLALFNA